MANTQKTDLLINQKMKGDAVKKIINGLDKLGKTTSGLKSTFSSFNSAVSSTVAEINKLTSYTDKYITSQRILNQTFGQGTKQINDYISQLNYMTGISEASISKSTSLFGQLATSLGMETEQAQDFSIALDDLTAKLSLLYAGSAGYDKFAKTIIQAMQGQSKSLTTLTGIVVKTQSLQATLDDLGIDAVVSDLSGADRAMLEYLTILKQVNISNEDLAKSANDVAWQKQILSNQIQRLSQAFGNLLYPVVKAILPILNAILIVITNIINAIASLVGYTGDISSNLSAGTNDWKNYGNAIETASKQAKKGLRGFDKLNNIQTPTPSTGTGGGGGGVSSALFDAIRKSQEDMLNIRNKAQEIADNIMDWLGFSKDADGQWKLSKVTLGGVLTLAGAILTAFETIYKVGKLISELKILDIFGEGSALTEAFSAIGEGIALWAGGAGTFGEVLTEIILPALTPILTIIGTVLLIAGGILETIDGINKIKLGEKFKGVLSIIEGIALIVGGILLAFGAWIPALIAVGVALVAEVIKRSEKIQEMIKSIGSWIYEKIIVPVGDFLGQIFKNVQLIFSKVWEIISKIIEIVIALGKAFATYVIDPIWQFIKPLFNWINNNIIKPLKDAFKVIGTVASDFIKGSIQGAVNAVFEKIEININSFIRLLNKAIDIINKIPGVNITKVSGLKLPRVEFKAEGGFVNADYFAMNENGNPEFLGHIGNKTAVANNDQITDAIASAVYKANIASQSKQSKQPIQIVAEGDASGLLDFITFKQKENDRQFGF